MTIEYIELAGSPKEHLDQNGANIQRVIICEWSDRIRLARELLGYTVGSVVYNPKMYEPEPNPDDLTGLYCSSVDIEPMGKYEKAKMTITYTNPVYNPEGRGEPIPGGPLGEVYISESLEPSSEFITLPKTLLYWDNSQAEPLSDEEDDFANPALLARMMDWVYTIHKIAYIPSICIDLPGYVNNNLVYSSSLGKSFATETLLCGSPSLDRQITSEGFTAWTITMRFTYRPTGWNRFPRPAEGGATMEWSYIYDASGNRKYIYPIANFGLLLP